MTEPLTVWTVGHSTQPAEELIAALVAHGVRLVADVRAFPGSRRHPQHGKERLREALAGAGIDYVWLGGPLGGRRRVGGASPNDAVRNASFRAYADHMGTDGFRHGVAELLAVARRRPTAVLCAELLPWRCHRSFLADHLVLVEGARVLHVQGERPAEEHVARPEARVQDGHLVYEKATDAESGRDSNLLGLRDPDEGSGQ